MKKLIVLAIAMLLVSLGAFAEVTLSGEIEYQWATDFASGFNDTTVIEINLTANVDDYDTVHIDLEPDAQLDGGAKLDGSLVEEAWFVQDLGGRFMLPEDYSLMVYYGFEEWESAGVGQISKGELEFGVLDWNPQGWGQKVSLGIMDMVTVDVVWLYSDSAGSGLGSSNNAYNMLVDVHGTISMVNFQVAYADETVDKDGAYAFGVGKIGFAADTKYAVNDDISVLGAGKFAYDIDTNGPEFAYSAAAGVDYMAMAGANLIFVGYDGSEANAMAIELWAQPVELLYLQMIANLGLDSDVWEETFDTLEIVAELNVGQVDWYIGYIYQAEAGTLPTGIDKDYSEQYPAALNPGNTGAMFVGGEIKY